MKWSGPAKTIHRVRGCSSALGWGSNAHHSSSSVMRAVRKSTRACCSWCASASGRRSRPATKRATWIPTTSAGFEGLLLHVPRVQTALFERFLFPPPAALAFVLSRIDRPCAWLAADRNKPALVQRIVRHVVRANICPHLLRRPIRNRIELHQRPLV